MSSAPTEGSKFDTNTLVPASKRVPPTWTAGTDDAKPDGRAARWSNRSWPHWPSASPSRYWLQKHRRWWESRPRWCRMIIRLSKYVHECHHCMVHHGLDGVHDELARYRYHLRCHHHVLMDLMHDDHCHHHGHRHDLDHHRDHHDHDHHHANHLAIGLDIQHDQ